MIISYHEFMGISKENYIFFLENSKVIEYENLKFNEILEEI